MFKVGDRVRVKPQYVVKGRLEEGVTYEIESIHSVYGTWDGIKLKGVYPYPSACGFHPCRFELVEEPSFCLSTATDKELADEYRRRRAENVSLYNELVNRGYTIFFNGQGLKAPAPTTDVSIRKIETIEL